MMRISQRTLGYISWRSFFISGSVTDGMSYASIQVTGDTAPTVAPRKTKHMGAALQPSCRLVAWRRCWLVGQTCAALQSILSFLWTLLRFEWRRRILAT